MHVVVEDFHGTQVADPYRWLEDLKDPSVQAWIAERQARTEEFFSSLPFRGAIEKRLREMWNYPKVSAPMKRGGRLFFHRNEGLQNQPALWVRDSSGQRIVLDPNEWSTDGTVALEQFGLNEDGSLIAYAISARGSDWQEVRVRDVESGRELPDRLSWVRFTALSFDAQSKGFYYSRYPVAGTVPPGDENYYQSLYYHRLGTPQEEDLLVYARPENKDLGVSGSVTQDGRFLVISVWKGTDKNNEVYVQRISDGFTMPLVTGFDVSAHVIECIGDTFYLLTDWAAPRRRVMAVDFVHPSRDLWREILPQGVDVLNSVTLAGDQLIALILHRAHHRLHTYDLLGRRTGDIPLPDLGTVGSLSGRKGDDELFLGFSSYLIPFTSYRYHLKSGQMEPWHLPEVALDAERYLARQVFYESKDGTLVSMFLVHRKGIRLDGQNPTYLYGYGGFNIDMLPSFSVQFWFWLEIGGILAIPNLRGGGEYGEEWHAAGMLSRKQNVFDDFIAAGEWLIQGGYTSPRKLAIGGGSNGGLLTAACMVQRPELFGAVFCAVPVIDMLRYHLFTIGRYWIPEYGCAEDPEHFAFLYAYSPLHNVRDGVVFPPILVATADTDDRVHPCHALKFTARLQEVNAPVFLRVESKAGHGHGKPTSKALQSGAELWAFLCGHLQMDVSV